MIGTRGRASGAPGRQLRRGGRGSRRVRLSEEGRKTWKEGVRGRVFSDHKWWRLSGGKREGLSEGKARGSLPMKG